MNSKLMVVLALTLSACGGSPSGGTNYSPTLPVDPYAELSDGIHVLSFTCSNSDTMELSNSPAIRTLRGIVGSYESRHATTAATCQLKVVSIKNKAGRPYDVIITSGLPTSVTNGHVWPYSIFPLCVGSTDLSFTSSCVNTGIPQTDATGVATINIAIDGAHDWNGLINLKSTLKRNEDGNSYVGTNQAFAIISGMNGMWVNNNGITCTNNGSGSCSSGAYTGFKNLISPPDFNCQVLSGYGQDFYGITNLPICQPL